MSEMLTEEQRRAVETIDRNIALSAGAGSGKTKVLVDRYFYILENGVRRGGGELTPADILAITFTRKAAGEMRSRIRKKLLAKIEAAGVEPGANSGQSGAATDRDFWRRQLKGLEFAQISTIHSLCSRILKENPLKCGLDPGFNLLEDFDSSQFEEERLDEYLEREFAAGNEDLKLLLAAYGLDRVRNNLLQVYPEMVKLAKGYDLTVDCYRKYAVLLLQEKITLLKQTLRELVKASKYVDEMPRKKKITKAHERLWLIDRHLAAIEAGLDKLPPDLVLFDKLAHFQSRVPDLFKDGINKLKELRTGIDLFLADYASEPCVRAWQRLALGYAQHLHAKKLEQNVLGFDDLERLAIELLESDRDICRRYRETFSYIMVDEFQDTNDRQRRLVYLLAGGDAEVLKDNRLFVVGDPKQSIYRFRGADVSVFGRVQADVGEEGCLKLSVNFRSTESILEAANTVFARLMAEPGAFSRLEPAEANRGQGVKPLLLEVCYGRNPESGIGSENRSLKLEFEAVAEEMENLYQENGIPFEDMTVLLNVMTHCDILTDALRRHGIPYRVIDGKGFYERQEVLDLLNLFKVVRNRRRSLELAGVLRSPYFGLSDATITSLFLECQDAKQDAKKCLWDVLELLGREIRSGDRNLAEKLSLDGRELKLAAGAAETLAKLRSFGSVCSLPEFMQMVWSVLHVELCLKLQDEGDSKLANARKLRRLAEDYASQKNASLGSWLEHVADLFREARENRSTVAETAANTAGGGVEIMTIHKSKGLERRVVFVPMLDKSVKADKDEVKLRCCALAYAPEPTWHLGIKAPLPDGSLEETTVLAQLKARDKELEDAESIRKLYVAMTRAREVLVLSGAARILYGGALSENGWLFEVLGTCEDAISCKQIYEYDLTNDAVAQLDKERKAAMPEDVLSPGELALTKPLAAFKRPVSMAFSPSELQDYLYCPRRYFYGHVKGYPEIDLTEKSGGALPAHLVGSIVHRALELYHRQLDDKERAYAASIFAQAVEELAPGADASEARELFLSYTASELYAKIQDSSREFKFALPFDASLAFKGIIDCLRHEGDAIRIVDFKTGKLGKDSASLKGYELQLAIYKAAAERLFPGKKVSAALHFLKGEQGPVAWELPAKSAALTEAVALCSEIGAKTEEEQFARVSEAEAAPACRHCPYSYVCRRAARS